MRPPVTVGSIQQNHITRMRQERSYSGFLGIDMTIGFDGPAPEVCQWIEGEGDNVCGKKRDGKSSYCPEHLARTVRSATPYEEALTG